MADDPQSVPPAPRRVRLRRSRSRLPLRRRPEARRSRPRPPARRRRPRKAGRRRRRSPRSARPAAARRMCRCRVPAGCRTRCPGAVVAAQLLGRRLDAIVVPADRLVEVATRLRDADGATFDYCSDVTAVDWPSRAAARFDVVYCLYSTALRHRVRLKVRVPDGAPSRRSLASGPRRTGSSARCTTCSGSGSPDTRISGGS